MRISGITAALLVALTARVAVAEETPPACTYGPGALPVQTLAAGSPHGAQIPIDHIVVLMQENRSFDHYFGRLRRKSGPPRNASNPSPID
jgi:phospholipase C